MPKSKPGTPSARAVTCTQTGEPRAPQGPYCSQRPERIQINMNQGKRGHVIEPPFQKSKQWSALQIRDQNTPHDLAPRTRRPEETPDMRLHTTQTKSCSSLLPFLSPSQATGEHILRILIQQFKSLSSQALCQLSSFRASSLSLPWKTMTVF